MKTVSHVSALAIVTVIILLVYTSVQQSYRSVANDPQVQLIRDLKGRLEAGKPIDTYFNVDTIDLEKSLSVFVEIYDTKGKPIKSSGLINSKLPVLPAGVLNVTKSSGEDWVTWQPQKNVRLAMGVAKVNAPPVAFIAVGRSLVEVENRTAKLKQMIISAWIICLIIIVIHFNVQSYLSKAKKVDFVQEQQMAGHE
jgi:hypothetical protein